MKKLMFAVALLLPTVGFCWEHPKNPDRFPSVGFSLSGSAEDGDYKTQGVSQDLESKGSSLFVDTRLPLSNSFTLSVGLGTTKSTVDAKDNPFFFGSKSQLSGSVFSIGGRFYFNN